MAQEGREQSAPAVASQPCEVSQGREPSLEREQSLLNLEVPILMHGFTCELTISSLDGVSPCP